MEEDSTVESSKTNSDDKGTTSTGAEKLRVDIGPEMDVDSVGTPGSPARERDPPKREREPSWFMLGNPSRVTPSQAKYISILEDNRYVPVGHRRPPTGIVMLIDKDPTAPENVTTGIILCT